jgi:hypothetical protein
MQHTLHRGHTASGVDTLYLQQSNIYYIRVSDKDTTLPNEFVQVFEPHIGILIIEIFTHGHNDVVGRVISSLTFSISYEFLHLQMASNRYRTDMQQTMPAYWYSRVK